MLTQSHHTATALLARFRSVRSATMDFCAPLTPEDLMVQSCPEASPVKWHLAHTSWFFETFVLREFVAAYQPFDPDFLWLFNSYYKSLGDMPEKKLRASFSRPPLDQILAYRETVDTGICRLLEHMPEDEALRRIVSASSTSSSTSNSSPPISSTPSSPILFTRLIPRRTCSPNRTTIAPPLDWVNFSPGPGRPGVVESASQPDPAAIDTFAFDNETPRHPVYIAPFRLASRLVTCAEYLAFIDRRRLRPSRALALRRLGPRCAPKAGKRRSTGSATPTETALRLEHLHPPRLPAARRALRNSRLPPQLLRSRRFRALGRLPPAYRVRMGVCRRATGHHSAKSAGGIIASHLSNRLSASSRRFDPDNLLEVRQPSPHPSYSLPPACSKSTAMCGSGPNRPTPATPAIILFPALLASTTASSCRRRWSSAAAPALRLKPTSAPPIGTSSNHPSAGNSAASAWHAMEPANPTLCHSRRESASSFAVACSSSRLYTS